MSENQKRQQLGLRLVGRNWYLYRQEFGAEDYKLSADSYLTKRIQRDPKGGLLWEEDYYLSGKTFTTFKGQIIQEQLTIHYDYGTTNLEIAYIGQDTNVLQLLEALKTEPASDAKKLLIADQLLKNWNVSRL